MNLEMNYYIQLLGENIDRKWYYSDFKIRNNIYENVRKMFEKERTGQIPFIEVDIGSEKQSAGSVTFPLRLSPEMKDEVTKYIDSLS